MRNTLPSVATMTNVLSPSVSTAFDAIEITLRRPLSLTSTFANISGFSRWSLFGTTQRILTVRVAGSTTSPTCPTRPANFSPG